MGIDVITACVILFSVCIFFSSIGGIKAVMWTDTFQVNKFYYGIFLKSWNVGFFALN